MAFNYFFLIFFLLFLVNADIKYNVSHVHRVQRKPLIVHDNDNDFTYNYNPAVIQKPHHSQDTALLVRVQNKKRGGSIYDVLNSEIAFTSSRDGLHFSPIKNKSVVYSASIANKTSKKTYPGAAAVEDPRLVTFTKGRKKPLYLMYYSLVSFVPRNGAMWTNVRLSLATTEDPSSSTAWKTHGPIFKDNGTQWTKSGAMLIREEGPHYLFFGDSSLVKGMQYATCPQDDFFNWTLHEPVWLPIRPGMFDSRLVEAAASPIRMPTGDYFMLYNSAAVVNITNPKPNWNLEYRIGWVILDGKDPTKIIHRSNTPIMVPYLPWETGTNKTDPSYNTTLTPLVVFVEGVKLLTMAKTHMIIRLYYGGGDTAIGAADMRIGWSGGYTTVTTQPAPTKQNVAKRYGMILGIVLAVIVVVAIVFAACYYRFTLRIRSSRAQLNEMGEDAELGRGGKAGKYVPLSA